MNFDLEGRACCSYKNNWTRGSWKAAKFRKSKNMQILELTIDTIDTSYVWQSSISIVTDGGVTTRSRNSSMLSKLTKNLVALPLHVRSSGYLVSTWVKKKYAGRNQRGNRARTRGSKESFVFANRNSAPWTWTCSACEMRLRGNQSLEKKREREKKRTGKFSWTGVIV